MNTLSSSLSRRAARAVVLTAVVALTACSATIESGGGETRALIDRVPAGATSVAWIDLEALAQAMPQEQWDDYQGMVQDEADIETYERFVEATGIDPRTDVTQMAFASMPAVGDSEGEFLMLMSAEFDRGKLEELAAGADSVTYEGVTFYESDDVFRALGEAVGEPQNDMGAAAPTTNPAYLAILDDRTLAMGTEQGLRVAIDVGSGAHDTLQADAEMMAHVNDVSEDGQIWFVAKRDTWQERVAGMGQGAMVPTDAIEGIETMTLSLQLGDGMILRIAGIAGTAEAAAELAKSLNGVMAMGRMMLQQNEPELYDIIDRGLSVGQDDRTVRIEANLTQGDLEVLQRLAEEQMPQ